MHLWAFLRGSCVVRSQQLGIWFGHLGPMDGCEEGDGRTSVLNEVLVDSLKVDWAQLAWLGG